MDVHQRGKMSRQLSDLAAETNIGGSASSASHDLSGQWTQFSGISPQAGQTPFRNLCATNPMDLPDFKPLSEPMISNIDSSPNHFNADPGMYSGCSNFLNQSQFDWQRTGSTQQKFQVSGDLAGRLVDVSRNRIHGCPFDNQNHSNLEQDNFQSANNIFQYHGVGSSSNVPIHRQMSQPSTPNPFVSSDRSSRHSLSSASNMSLLSNTMRAENLLQDDATLISNVAQCELTHGNSIKSLSHMHLLQTPPIFDPSTPPPLFPLEKHSSENLQTSGHFSNAPNDTTNYLHRNERMSTNLNFGTTIDKTYQTPMSCVDSTFINADGTSLWDAGQKQWHSFEPNRMLSLDSLTTSQTQPHIQELLPERVISADSSKPSYSDIAKTPRNASAFSTKIDKHNVDGSVRSVLGKTKKDEKPLQQHSVTRASSISSIWPRGSQAGEIDQPRVASTSRYGLDSFDEQFGSHTSSSESLSNVVRNRTDSDSNMDSSVGNLDSILSHEEIGSISTENYAVDHVLGASSSAHKQPILSANPARLPLTSKPQNSSVSPISSKERLFFDPRRIFQYKNTYKYQTQTSAPSKSKEVAGAGLDDFGISSSDTILNNGKPTNTTSSKLPSNARQHDYINNDLRDASKLTNQTAAESGQGTNGGKTEQHKQKESRVGKKYIGRTNCLHLRNKRSTSDVDKSVEDPLEDGSNIQQEESGLWLDIDREKLEEWCSLIWEKLSHWGNLFITSLLHLLICVLGIIVYLASVAIHLFVLLIGKFWRPIKARLFRGYFGTKEGSTWASHDHLRRHVGLEENIGLPATGDEAMKRLLACKGKDPYSILGLRADSSDEDIKKYYRKQAVLVHPDKNQELGAEEAFKILGHAFEMIGEPAKRRQYDSHTQETNEAEAMREFAEMLSKLQTKIQEAANIMHCDNCGGKHRRVPVERPFYSARFCQRCNTRHSAKESDVWAESTMLGFYWHYFALMEGHVYDITDWMKCHKEYFSNMKANSHAVQYRIATEGNRRNKHHQPGEPNLEDFINRLFKSSAASDGQRPSWGTSQPGTENSWAQSATAAATAAAAKKNRRKKKRH